MRHEHFLNSTQKFGTLKHFPLIKKNIRYSIFAQCQATLKNILFPV